MKTIEVTARFEVTFTHRVTDEVLKRLEAGVPVDDLIDESIPYRIAATDGTCEMDWEPAPAPKAPKAPKTKRRKR